MADPERRKEVRGLLKAAPESPEPYPLFCLDEAGSIPWPNAQQEYERLVRIGVVRPVLREVILQGRDAEGRLTQETVARYFYTRTGELEEIDRLEESAHLTHGELIAGILGLVELPEKNEQDEK